MAKTKHVDVTIRMPKDWFDRFWGWWLDGGGEQMFLEDVDLTECEEEITWSDWKKSKRLLVHAKTEFDLKAYLQAK